MPKTTERKREWQIYHYTPYYERVKFEKSATIEPVESSWRPVHQEALRRCGSKVRFKEDTLDRPYSYSKSRREEEMDCQSLEFCVHWMVILKKSHFYEWGEPSRYKLVNVRTKEEIPMEAFGL